MFVWSVCAFLFLNLEVLGVDSLYSVYAMCDDDDDDDVRVFSDFSHRLTLLFILKDYRQSTV